jgi:hypothetical protein
VHLLNLSLAEFAALFSAASAIVVALYFLDRSRRTVAVATLRFWNEARRPVESAQRRRIRQWPSLLLQLLSTALLLLAISQLRWGSRETASRDHVLLLDTSAFTAARAGQRTLLDLAKAQALAYVRALPPGDRVMVAYADGLMTPATSFESDRRKIERAIRLARPRPSALNAAQAIEFATQAQARQARRRGEIVLAGGSRLVTGEQATPAQWPANFRLLAVEPKPENTGIRKVGLRPSLDDPSLWRILVSVRNYGARPHTGELILAFGGAPAGAKTVNLAPGQETEYAFDYRTRAAGILEARLSVRGDAYDGDNRAAVELPARPELALTVCSDEPQLLSALLASLPSVKASIRTRAQCAAQPPQGAAIYDRFVPQGTPPGPSLYIDPPAEQSPVPVLSRVRGERIETWNATHPAALGLRAQDFRLDSTLVFRAAPADAVASSPSGPVAVTRESPGEPRIAVLGFHPSRSALRYELATPLLYANILRWFAPEVFRRAETFAASVGAVSVPIGASPASLRVLDENGEALPFSAAGRQLRFYAPQTGTVRVVEDGREHVFSLALPEIPETAWTAPGQLKRGVPPPARYGGPARDLRPWLALLGALGILLDWLLFAPAGSTAALPSSLRRRAA